MLTQVRIHGRGGQGSVTASQILAIAAFQDGNHCQAFPNFGVERRGAPAMAFVRISDKPIHLRCHVHHPDIVIVLDASLINAFDVTSGMKKGGVIIINSNKPPEELNIKGDFEIHTADATTVALEFFKANIVNTPMLGAFVKATGLISLKSIYKGIEERFDGNSKIIESNKKAVKKVYDYLK